VAERPKQDLYQILGVARDADENAIPKAYPDSRFNRNFSPG